MMRGHLAAQRLVIAGRAGRSRAGGVIRCQVQFREQRSQALRWRGNIRGGRCWPGSLIIGLADGGGWTRIGAASGHSHSMTRLQQEQLDSTWPSP